MAVQVKYLEIVPLVAAELVKKGDFLAPSYPDKKYGYGCILYDHFCSTAFTGTLRAPSQQYWNIAKTSLYVLGCFMQGEPCWAALQGNAQCYCNA